VEDFGQGAGGTFSDPVEFGFVFFGLIGLVRYLDFVVVHAWASEAVAVVKMRKARR